MNDAASTMHAPDAAERRRALDPAHSFIVQAPAGSGKTGLLIQRYLMLLAQVDAPEEIVAITFTRKAAAEMRERVLAALAQAGATPATAHEQLTRELAAAALRRDAAAGWQIAANPARLRIQTIDSLCAALTRQMPMLSRFGSQPDSIEDASVLYLEAARATIGQIERDAAVAQDVEQLLIHLDNDVARVEALLAAMLARRDHWLRHIHGQEREQLEVALCHARREVLARLCDLYPIPARNELLELARYAAANLATAGKESPLIACAGPDGWPGNEETDAARWRGVAELLLTKDGAWRKQHTINDGFPAGDGKAEKETAKAWKARALTLIDALSADDALRQALHDTRTLPPPAYTDQQWAVLGAITRLLPHTVAQLKLVFQLRGEVDFTEVAQGAVHALGEADAPTDLALALDYRIRHLLMDEFQDTSLSQYELVAKLTAGWEPGDGRSLFAVGDPMQSIYRFREAEVGLFMRARAAGIGGIALQPIVLRANFRSQCGIVDWVNATFAQVMPAHEDIAAGAVPYTQSVATRPALAGTAVSVHPFFNGSHAAEAERVTEIVMQARCDPSASVAILVRNRSHLQEIVPRLKQAGLRLRAIEIEGLGERPVVQDLLALTRALAHPADRLAWLAVLRAPWCGLTLADLHALVAAQSAAAPDAGQNAREEGRTVWELLNDDARTAALSADGCARLRRVRQVLGDCIANRCRQSLRATVESAWLALAGPACLGRDGNASELEDADIYFDYLEAHEQAGAIPEVAAFEQELGQLYALPDLEADDRLQVMTIHKAKGLEFDHVIVPGLGRVPRNSDKRLLMWMERPRAGEQEGRVDLLLAPIQETGADGDPIYAWLEKLEGEKERFEDERLLYVAATRAKQRLHLLGNAPLVPGRDGMAELKPPARKSLLGRLWPAVQPIYAAAAAQPVLADTVVATDEVEAAAVDQTLGRLAAGWALPPAPPRVAWPPPPDITRAQDEIEFSWVSETARHIGSVVHRWLQRIAEEEMMGWDAARIQSLRAAFRQQLAAHAVIASDLDQAAERVVAALTHAVSDARGRWLLGRQTGAHNELRLTAIIDGERLNLVLDRTFQDVDGIRWIVDYKTSSHEGADVEGFLDREQQRYRGQLERYARLMRATGEQAVKLGLYFPLLRGWREWRSED